jgi:hypothetical protein
MADKTKLWKEIVSSIRQVSPSVKSYFDDVADKLSWLDDDLIQFTTEAPGVDPRGSKFIPQSREVVIVGNSVLDAVRKARHEGSHLLMHDLGQSDNSVRSWNNTPAELPPEWRAQPDYTYKHPEIVYQVDELLPRPGHELDMIELEEYLPKYVPNYYRLPEWADEIVRSWASHRTGQNFFGRYGDEDIKLGHRIIQERVPQIAEIVGTESTRNLLKDWMPLLDDAVNTSVR